MNHQPDDPGVRPGTRKLTLTECWHLAAMAAIVVVGLVALVWEAWAHV